MSDNMAAVLRRPPFALLVAGQTISQFGDKLHHMALIALVGSAATANTGGIELAKLSVVFTLPVVLFGPLAGALVDRWNKYLTMVVCDALRAIIVVLIPTFYAAVNHLWPVYLVASLVFLLGIFFNAAKMAMIPDLVEEHQLLPANAALTSIGRVATVAGIVGGGIIVGLGVWQTIGWNAYTAGFYLDAFSYVISVITLGAISILHVARVADRPGHLDRRVAADTVKRQFSHLVVDLRRIITLIGAERGLRFAFGSVVLLAAFAASVYVVMTAAVQTVMGKGTAGVGYLGGLLAAGLIPGSLLVGTVGRRWDKKHTIMVGCAVAGLLIFLASLFFSYAFFVPVAVVGGMTLGPIMVSQDTLLHELAPREARALIFSTRDLVLGASFMVSALVVGGGVAVLGGLGVQEPYRLALGIVGLLIFGAAVMGWIAVLREGSRNR